MPFDFAKIKHEVDQLAALDSAAQAARDKTALDAVALTQAQENAHASELAEGLANAAVTAEIAYLTGLLGATPPTDDPTPDPVPPPAP